MMTKKFLIPFVLASLAGHALVLALTTRIDWAVSPPSEPAQKVMTVELKTPPEKAARRPLRRSSGAAAGGTAPAPSARIRQPCRANTSPYRDYLLQIRRKIERLWSYPPQALAEQEEGNAVIRFTIDADGSLSGYDVITTSGARSSTRGRSPSSGPPPPTPPSPRTFNLSRLHITATFSYRMGE